VNKELSVDARNTPKLQFQEGASRSLQNNISNPQTKVSIKRYVAREGIAE
jgi:hypothetical protein